MDAIDILAIILSVVSLIVTVVGFFASLKFYRDGVELQGKANDALTKLSEKTDFIQTQVGGMFDKTLDAALSQHNNLSSNFEELEQQLAATKEALLGEVRGQIGEAGEQQQQRIKQAVEGHIRLLEEKVESTKESAEEVVVGSIENRGVGTEVSASFLLKMLAHAQKPVSLSEVVVWVKMRNSQIKSSSIRPKLTDLVNKGLVNRSEESGRWKYSITEHGRKFID